MVNRLRFFRGSFCQRFSDPMFAKRYDTVSVCMYVCKTSVLLKIRPFPFPSNERERQNFETAQRKLNLELTLTYHNQKSCLSKTLQYIAKYRYWLNIILDSGADFLLSLSSREREQRSEVLSHQSSGESSIEVFRTFWSWSTILWDSCQPGRPLTI